MNHWVFALLFGCLVGLVVYSISSSRNNPGTFLAGSLSVPVESPEEEALDDEDERYEASLPPVKPARTQPHSLVEQEEDEEEHEEIDDTSDSVTTPEIKKKEGIRDIGETEEKDEEKQEDIIKKDKPEKRETAIPNNAPKSSDGVGGGGFTAYTQGDVLFWEVAWMGVTGNGNEEFIELYNSSTQEIILDGFSITKGDGSFLVGESGDRFNSSHRLRPYNYFLLKRSADEITATSAKNYDGSLGNSGGTLILKDALGNEIDRIAMEQGWAAGSNEATIDSYKPTMSMIEGLWQHGIPTPGFANKPIPQAPIVPSTPLIIYASSTIIISEVAWMGNASSSASEWIELANSTSSSINLDEWTLTIEMISASSTISLVGILDPLGYFLLERSDDASAPDVTGDFFYTGSLSNEGALLTLRDPSGAIIDQVGAINSPWPAGDNTTKKTMQKGEGWYTATPTPKAQNQKDPEPQISPLPLVMINEVAWMGTQASAGDEWLELRNTSSTQIGLAGWQLIIANDASSTPDVVIAFDEIDYINPDGFLLLERSSTSTIPLFDGKVYHGGQMNNGGKFIALIDPSGNIVDSIDASGGWPAGINVTSPDIVRASMERSEDGSFWHTFTGISVVSGSPMSKNS